MPSSNDAFNPFAPGFDFLQKLAQGAAAPASSGSSFPQWNDWVAPTMNVPDLEKRINELKTVLFWLEQNQRALAATIQAMEVQKMTLSTLQTMNVPVENWASTMVQSWQQFAKGGMAGQASGAGDTPVQAPPPPAPSAAPVDAYSGAAQAQSMERAPQNEAKSDSAESAAAGADPLQWWGALTQQFQHIAQQAVQDVTQRAMEHASSTQQVAASVAETLGAGTAKRTAAVAKKAAPATAAKAAPAAKRKAPAPSKTAASRKR